MGSRIIKINEISVIFGKCTSFNGTYNMSHPEIELSANMNRVYARHATVYPSTETLTNRVSNRMINKMMQQLFLETQTLFTEPYPII
jgi:ATP-dependent DNA helicase RecG